MIIAIIKHDVSKMQRSKLCSEEQRGMWRNEGGGGRARLMRLSDGRERDSGISAFPPGVFGLHDFICKAIINFLNEISN